MLTLHSGQVLISVGRPHCQKKVYMDDIRENVNVNGKSDNVTTIFPPLFHVTSCTLPFLRVSKLFHVCRVCSHKKNLKVHQNNFLLVM